MPGPKCTRWADVGPSNRNQDTRTATAESKHTMNSVLAFMLGEATRQKPLMVFDWNKAATLIKERKPSVACAGLSNDWEWTGGTIFENGKPNLESYTYLASTWARPELELDGESFACWVYQTESPEWDSGTKWPQSALDILNS